MPSKTTLTREQWLGAFADAARPRFKELGSPLPKKVRMSVGFPSQGQRSNVIGQCWKVEATSDGVSEIFLRPSLQADSRRIAGVLVHELCHAAGHWDHGSSFRTAQKNIDAMTDHTCLACGEGILTTEN